MLFARFFFRGSSAIVTGALLAACAQHGSGLTPSTSLAPQQGALPDVGPPACKGQKDTKQYASLTVKLSTKGGSFCIPEFGGFGGKIKYPSANPAVKLKLISSTTDYNHQPQLGQGTAIFYLQLAISGGTKFGDNVSARRRFDGAAHRPRTTVHGIRPSVSLRVPRQLRSVLCGSDQRKVRRRHRRNRNPFERRNRTRGGERSYRDLFGGADHQNVLGDGVG